VLFLNNDIDRYTQTEPVHELLKHVMGQLKSRCLAGTFPCGKDFIPALLDENALREILESPTPEFAAFISNPRKE